MGLLNDLARVIDDPPTPIGLAGCQDSAPLHADILIADGMQIGGLRPQSKRLDDTDEMYRIKGLHDMGLEARA